jgi:hypothetical protein
MERKMHSGSIKDGKLILVKKDYSDNLERFLGLMENDRFNGEKHEISLALFHDFAAAASQLNGPIGGYGHSGDILLNQGVPRQP